MKQLLILGCGYVGERLAHACLAAGMQVSATTRSAERADALQAAGISTLQLDTPGQLPDKLLRRVDAVLDSIPLQRSGTAMQASQPQWLPELSGRLPQLQWAGYLSATSVYGDAGGAWVSESDVCQPASERGQQRLLAEQAWLNASALPAEVFRLAGIYGPERNICARLLAGGYQAVQWSPAHWSNRIHVDDIVAALLAAMQQPRPGRIVNLADDEPLSHADYVCALAAMIGAPKPQLLTPEQGERQLSPMALAFFRDNKRISNRLLHRELLPVLQYPSFRDAVPGLMA